MDRSAALMNDPERTDYTYAAQLTYLNMAIDELLEILQESNSSPTNMTSAVITVAVGEFEITPTESATLPHYPDDLVELQGVLERLSGTTDVFVPLVRKDFVQAYPATTSLLFWHWEDQIIKFNPNGATTARDVQLQYIRATIQQAEDENTVIGTINAKSYLSYKTAALLSMFVGENETRAGILDVQAEKALERLLGLNNKGRQEIVTRHRPFRAGYKVRGY